MFAAILLSIIPYSPIIEDRVEVYEVNHFYDEAGKLVFTQRIFWDDELVRAWRIVHIEHVRIRAGEYIFSDQNQVGYFAGLRRIRCESFIESWTQFDRELENRAVLPIEERGELSTRP